MTEDFDDEELEWTQDMARDLAREGHRVLSHSLIEEWGNIHAVDQNIAEWKEHLLNVGIDLDNVDQCWVAAIIIERAFALVVSNMETCPYAEDLTDHMRIGMAPLVLTVDSAIRRHDGA